jgi:hypothetical protein
LRGDYEATADRVDADGNGAKMRMMGLFSFSTILIIASAIFFYRAARYDSAPAALWVVLSVATSLLAIRWLRWGLAGLLLGQLALFFGIAFVRVIRKS